jgi:hypothetical protein
MEKEEGKGREGGGGGGGVWLGRAKVELGTFWRGSSQLG